MVDVYEEEESELLISFNRKFSHLAQEISPFNELNRPSFVWVDRLGESSPAREGLLLVTITDVSIT